MSQSGWSDGSWSTHIWYRLVAYTEVDPAAHFSPRLIPSAAFISSCLRLKFQSSNQSLAFTENTFPFSILILAEALPSRA